MHDLLRYSAYMGLSEKDIESSVMVVHFIHNSIIKLKFTVVLKYSWVFMSTCHENFSKYLLKSVSKVRLKLKNINVDQVTPYLINFKV